MLELHIFDYAHSFFGEDLHSYALYWSYGQRHSFMYAAVEFPMI